MTQETKQAIYEAYINRENTVSAIAEHYHISKRDVAQIAVEMGAEPRRPKAYNKRGAGKGRICPKCRKTVDVKGAKYCCFCGADIRSKKELLIEQIDKAFNIIQFLPVNTRDDMQQLFLSIKEELKREN